jgi:HPt (histidine-containing phosphotransfer) domain-containing protein
MNPAEAADDGVLDLAVIGALLELATGEHENFVKELIDSFIADSPALIASMKTSVTNNDGEELRKLAHKLKGSSGALGATLLSAACLRVEELGREKNMDKAADPVAGLEREFARAAKALKAQLKR